MLSAVIKISYNCYVLATEGLYLMEQLVVSEHWIVEFHEELVVVAVVDL